MKRIILIILALVGLLFLIKDCNDTSRKIINNAIQDQKYITAVIDSEWVTIFDKHSYKYSFYIDSVKYTGIAKADLDKNKGDSIVVCYSVKNPAANFYYDKNDKSYTFSLFDVFVALILILIIVLYVRRSKQKATK
ncbi:hypothetical protein [Ferruginibacter albus]|uniref:hypothetical protein n=1 Tax=Ferruginibacter albus TaxID=2875540 RepID=UPI001CC5C512|nr:hypothetical protein [Ferruginibacter albus]UAY52926.1 hypothetical protein K9M53_04420 [Ferruginibacter albus]